MDYTTSPMIERVKSEYQEIQQELQELENDLDILLARINKVNAQENESVIEMRKYKEMIAELTIKLLYLKDKHSSITLSDYNHLYDLIVPIPGYEYAVSASLSMMQYYSYSLKRSAVILHDDCNQIESTICSLPQEDELLLAQNSTGYLLQAHECIEQSNFYESLCTQLLSNVFVCDNPVNALRLYQALGKKYRVVTLHGDLFDRYKATRFNINDSPIILQKQIRVIENIIEDKNTTLERLQLSIERFSKLHRNLLIMKLDLIVKIENRFIVMHAKTNEYQRLKNEFGIKKLEDK